MWQPRMFGIVVGWTAAISLAVYFFTDDLVHAGLFGEACKNYGLASWSCGVLPKIAVMAPNTFVYFLELPFTYNAEWDLIGANYASMILGSSIAYGLALVALNYWVWKLNQL